MDLQQPPEPPQGLYNEALGGDWFRLLRLERRTVSGELHFNLLSFEVENAPPYEALSYVWGYPYLDPETGKEDNILSFDDQIFCNGYPFLITLNVYDLLDTVFRMNPKATTWIDCICIDQSNANERAEQVPLMGRIYSKAQQTLAWLGGPHPHLKDFRWAVVEFHGAIKKLIEKRGFQFLYGKATSGTLLDGGFWQALELPVKGSLERLAGAAKYSSACRWFNRSWIVQEFLLSNNLLFLAGSKSFNLSDLSGLGEWFSTPWKQIFTRESLKLPAWVTYSPSLCYQVYVLDIEQKARRERKNSVAVDPSLDHAHSFSATQRILYNFYHLVRASRGTMCSDLRDQVYSLLGLLSLDLAAAGLDVNTMFQVDYKYFSAAYVYKNFAITMLSQFNDLRLLSLVENRDTSLENDLASWVPNLTNAQTGWPLGAPNLDQPSDRPRGVWGNVPFLGIKARVKDWTLFVQGVKIEALDRALQDWNASSLLSLGLPEVHSARPQSRARTMLLTATMLEPDCKDIEASEDDLRKSFCCHLTTLLAAEAAGASLEIDLTTAKNKLHELLDPYKPETEARDLPSVEIVLDYIEDSKTCSGADPTRLSADELAAARKACKRVSDLLDGTQSYLTRATMTTEARSMFKTQRNVLGPGSPRAQPGDEIWMLRAGTVPFILRPVQGPGPREYKLVGDCYLNEYMYGEKIIEDPQLFGRTEEICLV